MGGLHGPEEVRRRENLRALEDKRLRFAERLRAEGFAPERMLLLTGEGGGVIGLCREGGQVCLAIGPDFGGEGEFTLERYDTLPVRREDYLEESEGMAGLFGMGKKGAVGFYLIAERADGEFRIPVIANQSSVREFEGKKNPLLATKRRRGDANVAWKLSPLERRMLPDVERRLMEILK